MYYEKNEAVGIALKHNSSLRTFPYAIQKSLAIHQSDFTCPVKSLKDQCILISEEVKKTTEFNLQNSKYEARKMPNFVGTWNSMMLSFQFEINMSIRIPRMLGLF